MGETLDQYEEKEKEQLILTDPWGMSGFCLGNYLMLAEIYAIAYLDVESNELKRKWICLRWLTNQEPRHMWLYNLRRLSFYRITCRLIKEECRDLKIKEDAHFVTSVIERDIKEPRLEKVLEDFNTPKYMNALNLKKFKIDKGFGFYEKNINLLDSKCKIYLECDCKDRENAEVAIKAFEEIYTNLEEWVHKIKAGAAKMMTECLRDTKLKLKAGISTRWIMRIYRVAN